MSYLRTEGPAADPGSALNVGLMLISIAVVCIIAALLLHALLRRRPPLAADAQGRLPVGPDKGGLRWIYIGVGISSAVLLASTVWTIRTLAAIAAPHREPSLTLEVRAHQWWWEITYGAPGPAPAVVTANEIHIPVGEPVLFKLRTDDVIHSFWVPKLAGKTDMIPGQDNAMWVQADRPGIYRGQCAEFCGAQHAHMAFYVIAEEPAAFLAWQQKQLAASNAQQEQGQQGQRVRQGWQLFMQNCSSCHTVRGTPAAGRLGPDLTHLMSRRTIAAGMLPNNTGSLSGWVADAQSVKPGARMPSMDLRPQDLRAVVDYLETLQ